MPRRSDPSRPTLLVDAYNALHVTGVLPPAIAGPAPSDLARLIAHSRYANRTAWLVCDGAPPGARVSGGLIRQPAPGLERVDIVYAGPGRDADSAIERLIERDSAPRSLLVVSSDRRILKAARKRRCNAMPSEPFLAHLAHDHAHPKGPDLAYPQFALDVPLDSAETARWRKRLGLTGFDLPASPDPHKAPKPKATSPSPNPAETNTNYPPQPDEPLLEEALREWAGRLHLEDLDMSRWLTDEPGTDEAPA